MTFANCNEVLIALGANLGKDDNDNSKVLSRAMDRICRDIGPILKSSRFWRTPAFPAGSGPDFVNACVRVSTSLDPQRILQILHQIEADMGRVRQVRWAARTLDLDLLAAGNRISPDVATFAAWMEMPPDRQRTDAPDGLILPHPRLHERAFVLIPLAEVAPDWIHPVLGHSVADLCAALPPGDCAAMTPL